MTKEQEALLKYANDSAVFGGLQLTWEAIAEQLANPDWSKPGPWDKKWEQVVPFDLPEIWNSLPLEAKIMARIMAHEAIGRLSLE